MTIKFAGDKWGTRNAKSARSENNFMVMLLQGSLKSHMFDYDKKLRIRQEKVQAGLKQAFCFSSQ